MMDDIEARSVKSTLSGSIVNGYDEMVAMVDGF
jgi:hypothetical protein